MIRRYSPRFFAVCLMIPLLSACAGLGSTTGSGRATGMRHVPASSASPLATTVRPPADPAKVTAEGLRLARLLRDQGRFEGAVGIYAELQARGALRPLEMLEYASVAAQVQAPADSLALFGRTRRAMTEAGLTLAAPAQTTLCNGLGRARMALGQTEAALVDFDCTLAVDAHNVVALNAKGVLLDAIGQHGQARALLEQALELDPANSQVLNNLALSHLASGDSAQAIRLLSHESQIPAVRLNLAFVQSLQGDEHQARQTLSALMSPEQTAQAMDAFARYRQRIHAGTPLAQALLAASRELLPLRSADRDHHG